MNALDSLKTIAVQFLAFGFWQWAFKSSQHSFAMVALNQLFAFTATYFDWAKVGKTPPHHPAPTLRSGSPHSGAFRARAAYDLLRKSHLAPSAAPKVLRTLALQTPAFGLLKSHSASPELSRA